MEQEPSFSDLLILVRKYTMRIVGGTVIGVILSVIFMMLFVDRQYKSEAQLLVNQSNASETAIQYNDIQTNVNLVNTYKDIISGNAVLEQVNANLGNVFTVSQLRGAISVEQSANSQAFYISAIMESPTDAQNVVNNVITVFEDTLLDVYGEDVSSIYVMSQASYNPRQVSPNVFQNALIGGMIGFMLIVVIALVQELLDTRIKSVEDLTNMGLIHLTELNELTDTQIRNNRLRIEADNISTRKRV